MLPFLSFIALPKKGVTLKEVIFFERQKENEQTCSSTGLLLKCPKWPVTKADSGDTI